MPVPSCLRPPAATSSGQNTFPMAGFRAQELPPKGRHGAFPGLPLSGLIAMLHSTTVAGAAPEFDRLPNSPPPLAGGTLRLPPYNHRDGPALGCNATSASKLATERQAVPAMPVFAAILQCTQCISAVEAEGGGVPAEAHRHALFGIVSRLRHGGRSGPSAEYANAGASLPT